MRLAMTPLKRLASCFVAIMTLASPGLQAAPLFSPGNVCLDAHFRARVEALKEDVTRTRSTANNLDRGY